MCVDLLEAVLALVAVVTAPFLAIVAAAVVMVFMDRLATGYISWRGKKF